VLTFVTSSDPIEVDVLICLDEAERRVAEFAHTTVHELLLYAVHGLLHAAGFNDQNPSEFAAMHAEEDRLLSLVGVGDVFDPARHAEDNA
jgi:rRNA maturation RNase YbeY